MQANRLHQGIQDFTSKIFSNDPVEYNSAINLYIEPQAHYQSALVRTHGASRIKKLIAFEKLWVRKREVRGGLKKSGRGGVEGWDEANQTLTLPTLTTYSLPFSLPLLNVLITLPSTLILHLNTNEDGEADEEDAALYSEDEAAAATGDEDPNAELKLDGERERRLVITKWEEKSVLDSALGKNHLLASLYTTLLLPFLSYIILLLSGALFFHRTHRVRDGTIRYVVAAVAELFHAFEGEVARLMGGGGTHHAGGTVSNINAYYQSGKLDVQKRLAAAQEATTSSPTPSATASASATSNGTLPFPSGNRTPSLTKSTKPTFRPTSAQKVTTGSSFTHAQGQHAEPHEISAGGSYAAAVSKGGHGSANGVDPDGAEAAFVEAATE